MREILFRGKPITEQVISYYGFSRIWVNYCKDGFVYGSLVISKGRYYICVSALRKVNSCINNGRTSMIEVIPKTVGEYTGLTDKNGKKIFEGDIMSYINGDGDIQYLEVAFKDGYFCYIEEGNEWDNMLYSLNSLNAVVAGNIHDNSELLEGG